MTQTQARTHTASWRQVKSRHPASIALWNQYRLVSLMMGGYGTSGTTPVTVPTTEHLCGGTDTTDDAPTTIATHDKGVQVAVGSGTTQVVVDGLSAPVVALEIDDDHTTHKPVPSEHVQWLKTVQTKVIVVLAIKSPEDIKPTHDKRTEWEKAAVSDWRKKQKEQNLPAQNVRRIPALMTVINALLSL